MKHEEIDVSSDIFPCRPDLMRPSYKFAAFQSGICTLYLVRCGLKKLSDGQLYQQYKYCISASSPWSSAYCTTYYPFIIASNTARLPITPLFFAVFSWSASTQRSFFYHFLNAGVPFTLSAGSTVVSHSHNEHLPIQTAVEGTNHNFTTLRIPVTSFFETSIILAFASLKRNSTHHKPLPASTQEPRKKNST